MAQLVELGPGPSNEDERSMIEMLVDGLPSYYRVFPNITFRSVKSGQAYEYDAVVLTGHGIFVLEMKGWHGVIRAVNRREWQLESGRFVTNPLPLNDHKSRVLGSHLKQLKLRAGGDELRSPFVVGCLVGGGPSTRFDVFHGDRDVCLRPDQLCEFLSDPHSLPRFSPPETYRGSMRKIADFITGTLEARPVKPRRFASYKVTSTILQTNDESIYLAKHAEFDDGRVYRIRDYGVSHYRHSPEERKRKLQLRQRSAEALHRIGDHPNIVSLRAFGDTNDGFFEVTDWSDGGTLASALWLGDIEKMSADERLDILIGIVRGLAVAHAQGVLHRDLRPEAVLLGADGRPRVGEFDLAFIEDADDTVFGDHFGRSQEELSYRAPELTEPDEYQVFDNTDLYAVGRVAYDLFVGPGDRSRPLSELAELPRSWGAELSDLVTAMTAQDSADRPADVSVVLKRLEGLRSPGRQNRPSAGPLADGKYRVGDYIDESNAVLALRKEAPGYRLYHVRNAVLETEFDLKLASPSADPDAPLREFRLLEGVHHPNVVVGRWGGRLEDRDGGWSPSYVILEHLEGETLSERLRHHVIPAAEALAIIEPLVGAVAALHDSAIVHRNIHPGNVHLVERGPVLAAFDVAMTATAGNSSLVGLEAYRAPDLADGGWDYSCDVFALACVAFESITGKAAGAGLARSTTTERGSWPTVQGALPAVAAVVDRALDPARAERFCNARAFAEALAEAVRV